MVKISRPLIVDLSSRVGPLSSAAERSRVNVSHYWRIEIQMFLTAMMVPSFWVFITLPEISKIRRLPFLFLRQAEMWFLSGLRQFCVQIFYVFFSHVLKARGNIFFLFCNH